MPISIQEVAVYLALTKKHLDAAAGNRAFSLNMKMNGGIKAFGVNDARSGFDSRSSAVNLMQGSGIDRVGGYIASSDPPEARDLGMGRLRGLAFIAYLDPAAGLKYRTRAGDALTYPWGAVTDLTTIPLDGTNTVNLPRIANLHTNPNPPQAAYNWYNTYFVPNPPPQPNATNALLNRTRADFTGGAKPTKTFFVRPATAFALPATLVPVPGGREINAARNDIFLKLAWAAVGETIGVRNQGGPYPPGHSIGSVLRGQNDEILWWGLNTSSEHGTLHGETNLIQTLQNTGTINGAQLPGAATPETKPILYSTLEPCYMCAGMYSQSGINIYCYYGQDDPGINNNALQAAGNQNLLQSGFGKMVAAASNIIQGTPSAPPAAAALSVTGFLNVGVRKLFLNAISQYINIVPDTNDAARANWINHTTVESIVWENGLRLLYHINPGVAVKWFRRDRYYDVANFPKKLTQGQLNQN